LTGIPLVCWAIVANRRRAFRHVGANWFVGLLGGSGTLIAYSLVLWAMTQAPVAVVAALRETSILFGTIISVVVLKEKLGRRLAAASIIALGAIVLRLA
jgi:drug/metabolite transporter (DMT)-like permease